MEEWNSKAGIVEKWNNGRMGKSHGNESIHNVMNCSKTCHSREGGNPGKHWIPGQARNDNKEKTYCRCV